MNRYVSTRSEEAKRIIAGLTLKGMKLYPSSPRKRANAKAKLARRHENLAKRREVYDSKQATTNCDKRNALQMELETFLARV